MSAVVEKTIRLNGAPVTTAAETYADLRTDAVDTLIVNGHARPWQQMVIAGDDVLLFAADKQPSPALWRAIYDARYGRDVMDQLQAGSVAICGLGGLGSLVALELGRLGVGRLLLIDGDVVDGSIFHLCLMVLIGLDDEIVELEKGYFLGAVHCAEGCLEAQGMIKLNGFVDVVGRNADVLHTCCKIFDFHNESVFR